MEWEGRRGVLRLLVVAPIFARTQAGATRISNNYFDLTVNTGQGARPTT